MNPGISLEALAKDKGIDKVFLADLGLRQNGKGIEIPYYDEKKQLIRMRIRTALKAKDGTYWAEGDKIMPYGLWRLNDAKQDCYLILVEGESDCWTLWKNGFPALGIPGSTMVNVLILEYFLHIDTVYIIQEPDESGKKFIEKISEKLAELGFNGDVMVVNLAPYKDPNEYFQDIQSSFPQQFQLRLEQAEKIELKYSPDFSEIFQKNTLEFFPELPKSVKLAETFERDSSNWLDTYIKHSKKYSPRGADGYHEAVGLFILSTVAARRIYIPLGRKKFTPLYILLTGRTSLFAKSTTAEIGMNLIRESGLEFLLVPESITPQMFIKELSGQIHPSLEKLPQQKQKYLMNQLAFSAQRGWFYDEFSQQLIAMKRENSPMSDFKGIIRKFDDCLEKYEYSTIMRGKDLITKPYLSLLGVLTPADLKPFARSGNTFWNDGFWARFAFVLPLPTEKPQGRIELAKRIVPKQLIEKLQAFHDSLGEPEIQVNNGIIHRGHFPERECMVDENVVEAYYKYNEALLSIINKNSNTDFDGNYARFAEKALRIAVLLGAIENNFHVELCHWARSQNIVERWRRNLHELVIQVNENVSSNKERQEEKVLRHLAKLKRATAWEIKRKIRGMTAPEVEIVLSNQFKLGILKREKNGRGTYSYRIS